jgi:hypothetical protein
MHVAGGVLGPVSWCLGAECEVQSSEFQVSSFKFQVRRYERRGSPGLGASRTRGGSPCSPRTPGVVYSPTAGAVGLGRAKIRAREPGDAEGWNVRRRRPSRPRSRSVPHRSDSHDPSARFRKRVARISGLGSCARGGQTHRSRGARVEGGLPEDLRSCRRRVSSPALSVAGWVHSSAMGRRHFSCRPSPLRTGRSALPNPAPRSSFRRRRETDRDCGECAPSATRPSGADRRTASRCSSAAGCVDSARDTGSTSSGCGSSRSPARCR